MAPCTGASSQKWLFNASTGALQVYAADGAPSGKCLTENGPYSTMELVLCARVTSWYTPASHPLGYCLRLAVNGSWTAWSGSTLLQRGSWPSTLPPFEAASFNTMAVSALDTTIEFSLGGPARTSLAVVFRVTDSAFASGQVALGSGWHDARFDDFAVDAHAFL